MDSNENSGDMVIDTSKQMEVSDSRSDDKNEKENQSDKANSEKMETEESNTTETDDGTSKKMSNNEGEAKSEELKSSDGKINTSKNEAKKAESESKVSENKKEHEESARISALQDALQEADSADIETLNIAAISPPEKDTKDSKRKRKSTNTAAAASAAESASALEQNGSPPSSKRKKSDTRCDRYCWRCHKESVEAQCSACPRSWHRRCMGGAPPLSVSNWICGECAGILQAENAESRSPAMAGLTVDQLCMMLKHVVERMRDQSGSQPFWKAVDLEEVPNYLDYVVKPMDLSLLESNVRAKLYGSTDAFMADARWIQHNCIVFNTYTSKLTNTAKQMMKVARQEVAEIEACPDCFAHGRNLPRPLPSWFIEPCRRPHPIVWAKLKGFPFWPAKAMPRLNTHGLVDVRFFGEHDRAWVSPKDMFLYSVEPPVALPKKKKIEMELCVKEVEDHSKKLEQVFGEFRYAPPKVPYDPHDPMQIQVLLPTYDPITNTRLDTSKPEVEKTPANNKAAPAKPEKTPVSAKSPVVASTNGVVEPPSEKPKLVRKRKAASPPQPAVNKTTPDDTVEEVMIIEESKSNSKSKSPPATPVSNNNNVSTNSTVDSSEQKKTIDSSPEVTTILEVSRSSPKKVLTVRKIKSDAVKKLKLTKDLSSEEARKPSANGKATMSATPSQSQPQQQPLSKPQQLSKPQPQQALSKPQPQQPLPKAQQQPKPPPPPPPPPMPRDAPVGAPINAENARTPVLQKPNATVLHSTVKKPSMMVSVLSKQIGKSPRLESKLAKALTRVPSKELLKLPVNNVQKSKDDAANSRPMTAIPMSAKKDQTKAMHMAMNSNVSESARHFGDKEPRLNTTVPVIKQEPREDLQPKLTVVRKAGKARKSFPNKPTGFASVMSPGSSSRSHPRSSSNASDAMVYIPPQNNDVRAYELPPPEAGPATAKIHENSKELANRVAQLIADTIKDAAESNGVGPGSLVNHHEATIHFLKLRMERMKWEHQQEINELKHNNELVLRELKASMDVERNRALQEVRKEAEQEKSRLLEETKRKQWCVVCGREAMFYCCWNTAYCDYPCQQKHWSAHISSCAQKTQQPSPRAGSAAPAQPVLTGTGAKGQQNGNNCNEFRTLTTESM